MLRKRQLANGAAALVGLLALAAVVVQARARSDGALIAPAFQDIDETQAAAEYLSELASTGDRRRTRRFLGNAFAQIAGDDDETKHEIFSKYIATQRREPAQKIVELVRRGYRPPEDPQTSEKLPKWVDACASVRNSSTYAILLRTYETDQHDAVDPEARRRKKRSIKFYYDSDSILQNGAGFGARHTRRQPLAPLAGDSSNMIIGGAAKNAKSRKYADSPTTFVWSKPSKHYGGRSHFVSPNYLREPTAAHSAAFVAELREALGKQLMGDLDVSHQMNECINLATGIKNVIFEFLRILTVRIDEMARHMQPPRRSSSQVRDRLAARNDSNSSWLPSLYSLLEPNKYVSLSTARRDLTNIHQLLQIYALGLEQSWFDASPKEHEEGLFDGKLYDELGDLNHGLLRLLCCLERAAGSFAAAFENRTSIARIARPYNKRLADALDEGLSLNGRSVLELTEKWQAPSDHFRLLSPFIDEQTLIPRYKPELSPTEARLYKAAARQLVPDASPNESLALFAGRALMPAEARAVRHSSYEHYTRDYALGFKLSAVMNYLPAYIRHLFGQFRALRIVQKRLIDEAGVRF